PFLSPTGMVQPIGFNYGGGLDSLSRASFHHFSFIQSTADHTGGLDTYELVDHGRSCSNDPGTECTSDFDCTSGATCIPNSLGKAHVRNYRDTILGPFLFGLSVPSVEVNREETLAITNPSIYEVPSAATGRIQGQ